MKKYIDKIKGGFSGFSQKAGGFFKGAATFDYKNFLWVAIFLLVVIYFWKQIVEIFKPAQDAAAEKAAVTTVNVVYKNASQITEDGYFKNGLGQKTKYRITDARRDGESLAALLKTYKGANWYSVTFSLFGIGAISRIKDILNPGYPASYRRYVSQVYKDVYTTNRNLQTDVRNELTSLFGSNYWTTDLDKYFAY